jgi:hypothetical protein
VHWIWFPRCHVLHLLLEAAVATSLLSLVTAGRCTQFSSNAPTPCCCWLPLLHTHAAAAGMRVGSCEGSTPGPSLRKSSMYHQCNATNPHTLSSSMTLLSSSLGRMDPPHCFISTEYTCRAAHTNMPSSQQLQRQLLYDAHAWSSIQRRGQQCPPSTAGRWAVCLTAPAACCPLLSPTELSETGCCSGLENYDTMMLCDSKQSHWCAVRQGQQLLHAPSSQRLLLWC